mgnify:CR=1 FL=1
MTVAEGSGVLVMVGVFEGVGEGTVAVGVKVAVAVGVLVEKIPLNGLPDPETTAMMMKIPSKAKTPASAPSMYGIYFCRLANLLMIFCGLSFRFIITLLMFPVVMIEAQVRIVHESRKSVESI